MSIIRLHVTAEGHTEELFVKKVLSNHLFQHQVFPVVRCVLTSKDKRRGIEHRGGFRRHAAYDAVRKDIGAWVKHDNHPECRFTTMFDLYALPNDFPGYDQARQRADPYEKVRVLESALQEDIGDPRFIPYIQLHEFEALILSDPKQLDWEYLEHEQPIRRLTEMVGTQNPELIDEGPDTAPSKRILKEIPEYDKANTGPLVAGKIGIEKLMERCKHFREWVETLTKLPQAMDR